MQQGLFRKAALDKVSSPDQLDLLMQVTSPAGWLALLALAGLLALVAAWSVLGSVADLVDGRGVLMRGERLSEVKLSLDGTLVSLSVSPGAHIKAGQVLGVVSRDTAGIEERRADELALARDESMLETKRGELAAAQRQREAHAQLVRQGLEAANVMFEHDRRVNAIVAEINGLEREMALARARLKTTAEVKAAEAGRVVEVLKAAGDSVRAGEALLRLEPERAGDGSADVCGREVHAVLFVPAQAAGQVRPGQRARVSPLDVKREEYGYILGRVASVASHAASPEDMREKLKNETLVQSYLQGGPVFEARVCLEADPTNKANGLRWSTSRGPDRGVGAGVQCTASLEVDRRRPIAFVIPAAKKAVGF